MLEIPKIPHPVHLSDFLLQDLMISGVYFFFRNGVLVYVGQTRTMKCRLDSHISEGVKKFDSVSFIPCHPMYLTKIESYFINRYAPVYNRCPIANRTRQRSKWGAVAETPISAESSLPREAFLSEGEVLPPYSFVSRKQARAERVMKMKAYRKQRRADNQAMLEGQVSP